MEDLELVIRPEDYSLLTDLYQLTMTACYVGEKLDQKRASFELSVRRLPKGFGYLIAMGLAQVLEYLEKFHFNEAQILALQTSGIFDHAPEQFWTLLEGSRFEGDVWAVPEGTAVFANEPLLRVEAPLWQAQIAETYLLNTVNYQTLVATRAARMRDVAGENATLLEFGTRRAFSPQGSVWAARAALAGGLDATSNVLAALKLGRKPTGTMAHSLVMALNAMYKVHPEGNEGTESQAFTAFHRYFPGAPLLIDTYDTIAAAEALSKQLKAGEIQLAGVRIDSGDLLELSKKVRSLLPEVSIFASGDLDEYRIADLKANGAQIDGYGLGTQLVTGAPVNGVYKIVEIDGIPVMKEATGKVTYPGRKQIFRKSGVSDPSEFRFADRLGLMNEDANGEIPLLQLVFKQGQRITESETIAQIRDRTTKNVQSLPESARQLENPIAFPVELSHALSELTDRTRQRRHLS